MLHIRCATLIIMPYRVTPLVNDHFYHIYNRGTEKRLIFTNKRDYERFKETLYYYQFSGPKPRFSMKDRLKSNKFENNPKIVEIICYCLMPNHFHLLIKQLRENGIKELLRNVQDSYTKFFNTKYQRVGALLQGQFKANLVESEEQLIHLSRYIHLNPYVSDIVDDLEFYPYSSYRNFISLSGDFICKPDEILNLVRKDNYRDFVMDHSGYAAELESIKHLTIDD